MKTWAIGILVAVTLSVAGALAADGYGSRISRGNLVNRSSDQQINGVKDFTQQLIADGGIVVRDNLDLVSSSDGTDVLFSMPFGFSFLQIGSNSSKPFFINAANADTTVGNLHFNDDGACMGWPETDAQNVICFTEGPPSFFRLSLGAKSLVASGSDAFSVSNNGARWHIGAGTNDYFTSDGTIIYAGTDPICTANNGQCPGGGSSFIDGGYVDLVSDQFINGVKDFDGGIVVTKSVTIFSIANGSSVPLTIPNSFSGFLQIGTANSPTTPVFIQNDTGNMSTGNITLEDTSYCLTTGFGGSQLCNASFATAATSPNTTLLLGINPGDNFLELVDSSSAVRAEIGFNGALFSTTPYYWAMPTTYGVGGIAIGTYGGIVTAPTGILGIANVTGLLGAAGTGGTTDAVITITDGSSSCDCDIGPCNATGPVTANCNNVCSFLANTFIAFTVSSIGDCVTGPGVAGDLQIEYFYLPQ